MLETQQQLEGRRFMSPQFKMFFPQHLPLRLQFISLGLHCSIPGSSSQIYDSNFKQTLIINVL